MEALIPAAGFGRRLGKGPKPLVRLGGRPLIAHVIEGLERVGVGDILTTVGHRGGEVKEFLRDFKVEIIENPDYAKGSLYSLYHARDRLDRGFFLVPCDTIIEPRGLRKLAEEAEGIFTLGGTRKKGSTPLSVKEGFLAGVGDGDLYSTGVGILEPKIFDLVEELLPERPSLNDLPKGSLEKGEKVRVVDISRYRWHDIDTREDLDEAERGLAEART
jgi:choline kinase